MKLRYLILLCFAACWWQPNQYHHYTVVYGDGAQQVIITAVQQAVSDWQTDSNNFITFSFDDPSDQFENKGATITVYGDPVADIKTMPDANHDTVGITYWHGESCDIHIPYDLNDADFLRRITTHEFGHAIGLVHTGPDTIMYYNINGGATHITCADLAQVCNVWNNGSSDPDKTCDPTQMLGCENANVVPDGGQTLLCHVSGIYQPCDPSNPYFVQVGDNAFVSCEIDVCEYGQTCTLGNQTGVCDVEPYADD
jgi:hypothetical protein